MRECFFGFLGFKAKFLGKLAVISQFGFIYVVFFYPVIGNSTVKIVAS
jgi:hypothetical protein